MSCLHSCVEGISGPWPVRQASWRQHLQCASIFTFNRLTMTSSCLFQLMKNVNNIYEHPKTPLAQSPFGATLPHWDKYVLAKLPFFHYWLGRRQNYGLPWQPYACVRVQTSSVFEIRTRCTGVIIGSRTATKTQFSILINFMLRNLLAYAFVHEITSSWHTFGVHRLVL